jgi:hypothetical protein
LSGGKKRRRAALWASLAEREHPLSGGKKRRRAALWASLAEREHPLSGGEKKRRAIRTPTFCRLKRSAAGFLLRLRLSVSGLAS